ncbi:MAG TPA: Wzz/FepE/Etk N-terminal domain-containing protein, partial [Patescibacteria group bacterium]|nr:Wzz/FepE/Etk N-terminal domain-containing protein [Patescibacteria group bacterium]
MSQDNRLMPLSGFERSLDRPLSDLVQKPLGKPYGVAAESAGIKEYLFIVLKRKWLILSLVLVVTSLATIQAFRAPSIYQGESMIKIEQTAPNVLQTDKVVIQGPSDPKFWGTQLKLLENPTLARQVAITLDLQNNPAFFGGQAQGGVFTSLRRIFSGTAKPKPKPAVAPGLAVVTEQRVSASALTPEQLARLEPYEDAIIGGEVIEPVVGTSLVKIKFIHSDPEIAQKVANTLAEVFVNNNLERATENSTEAGDLLAREIANLQTKIKQTQESQWNYAKNKGLTLTNDASGGLEASRLATLSGQLLQAENERKQAQAQLEAARREKDPFSIPDVNASARVEKLRERISELTQK